MTNIPTTSTSLVAGTLLWPASRIASHTWLGFLVVDTGEVPAGATIHAGYAVPCAALGAGTSINVFPQLVVGTVALPQPATVSEALLALRDVSPVVESMPVPPVCVGSSCPQHLREQCARMCIHPASAYAQRSLPALLKCRTAPSCALCRSLVGLSGTGAVTRSCWTVSATATRSSARTTAPHCRYTLGPHAASPRTTASHAFPGARSFSCL